MTPEEIKALREKHGLSQEAFASLLNISFATVNRWENGKAKPQPDRVERMRQLSVGQTAPKASKLTAAMTADEIKALAIQMYKGEVFTSLQLQESQIHLLPMIFMPLTFMDNKTRRALAKKDFGMIYGKIAEALPRSINGYPILPSFTAVNKGDTKKVVAKLKEIQAAVEKL